MWISYYFQKLVTSTFEENMVSINIYIIIKVDIYFEIYPKVRIKIYKSNRDIEINILKGIF